MVNMKPNDSVQQTADALRAQTARLWGKQRAGELEESINALRKETKSSGLGVNLIVNK